MFLSVSVCVCVFVCLHCRAAHKFPSRLRASIKTLLQFLNRQTRGEDTGGGELREERRSEKRGDEVGNRREVVKYCSGPGSVLEVKKRRCRFVHQLLSSFWKSPVV